MPKTTKKKTHKTNTAPATLNKAEFVRKQPRTMTAKEVVAKAKTFGISLNDKYVHKVRSSAKVANRAKAGRRELPRPASNGAARVGDRSAEQLLRAVAAEIGLARAISMLQEEHQRVRRLIGR
jgi:hypothetical protein